MRRFIPFLAVCSLGFLSCVSQPGPQPEAPPPPVQTEPVIRDLSPSAAPPELNIAEPIPVDPVPEETAPAEPVQEEPAPVDPVPEEPESVPEEPIITEPVPEAPPVQPGFDYTSITEEVRTAAKIDIRELIGELNGIIRRGDFSAWTSRLDKSYLDRLSSREFLDTVSQTPKLKSRGEPLRDLEDYFINVVIPSRATMSDRVDDIDIEFIPEEEKVLAFRTAPNGQRQRLYELKNINGTWKIIN
jgi:hypothetical protein